MAARTAGSNSYASLQTVLLELVQVCAAAARHSILKCRKQFAKGRTIISYSQSLLLFLLPARLASENTEPAPRRVQELEHDRARSRSRRRRRRHHHRRHQDVPELPARPMSPPTEPRPMHTCFSPPARPPHRIPALHGLRANGDLFRVWSLANGL